MVLKLLSTSTSSRLLKLELQNKISKTCSFRLVTFTRQWYSTKHQPWTHYGFKIPVEIKPPDALLLKRIKTVAYIALGSNVGNRIYWIEEACNRISRKGIIIKRTSSLWETKPMYVLEQDNFLNGVIEVSTFNVF